MDTSLRDCEFAFEKRKGVANWSDNNIETTSLEK